MLTMPKHYSIEKLDPETGMTVLREMFPSGEADEYQFVLFSTSGIHGSYLTIEDVAETLGTDEEEKLTVMIVHHRTVFIQYGTIKIAASDVDFLKTLRASSVRAVEVING